jgi:hypothetical protein
MKEIPLVNNRGLVMVDDEDYEWLGQYKWYISKNKNTSYAATKINYKKAYMHRLIWERYNGDLLDKWIDHKNLIGLDNRKENLRLVNASKNAANQRKFQNRKFSSKYKGVIFNSVHKQWQANITYEGKENYIGLFKIEEDAAIAYDIMAIRLFKEFARTNFKINFQDNNVKSIIERIDNPKLYSSSSKFFGVYKDKSRNKFVAQCNIPYDNGYKLSTIGRFDSENDAGMAYDYYMIHLFPDVKTLNFPNSKQEDYIKIKNIILQKKNKLPFKSLY